MSDTNKDKFYKDEAYKAVSAGTAVTFSPSYRDPRELKKAPEIILGAGFWDHPNASSIRVGDEISLRRPRSKWAIWLDRILHPFKHLALTEIKRGTVTSVSTDEQYPNLK